MHAYISHNPSICWISQLNLFLTRFKQHNITLFGVHVTCVCVSSPLSVFGLVWLLLQKWYWANILQSLLWHCNNRVNRASEPGTKKHGNKNEWTRWNASVDVKTDNEVIIYGGYTCNTINSTRFRTSLRQLNFTCDSNFTTILSFQFNL